MMISGFSYGQDHNLAPRVRRLKPLTLAQRMDLQAAPTMDVWAKREPLPRSTPKKRGAL